ISKSIYNNNNLFAISEVNREPSNRITIKFVERGIDLHTYFSINQSFNLHALIVSFFNSNIENPHADFFDSNVIVKVIGEDFITVESLARKQLIASNRTGVPPGGSNSTPMNSHFVAGFAHLPVEAFQNHFVGGVRVKEVSVKCFDLRKPSTQYSYN